MANFNSVPCDYATLQNYNAQMAGVVGANPTSNVVTGQYLVPNWGSISYNALQYGAIPSCSGYPSITNAYGAGAGNCQTQYINSPCNN